MLKKRFYLAITLAVSALTHADTLSFKFQDGQDTPFSATDVAGVAPYASAQWNFLQTDWSGNADNDVVLSDVKNSSGANTTSLVGITYGANVDPVHYDSANTWRSGAGNADPNATLMNGYLDDGGDDQPYVNFSLAADALPLYTVVVYVHGDVASGAIGRYWIEEWTDPLTAGTPITDQVGIDSNDYEGTFIQAGPDFSQTDTPTDVTAAEGNYIVFTDLTARNFRVRSSGNGDPEDYGRGPLNAIQILDAVANPDDDDDNDGLLNGWEISFGLDPDSDAGDDGADGDPDNDTLTNAQEQDLGTSPILADSDGDDLDDNVESNSGTYVDENDTGTDPRNRDTDDDGLRDGAENNTGTFVDADMTGSSPLSDDTDSDNLPDGYEVANELDPSDNGDTDVNNGAAGDPDEDSSENLEELQRGTDPQEFDTDQDGVRDGYEDDTGTFVDETMTGTDPLDPDSDDDSLPDGVESGSGTFVDADDTGTNPLLHDSDADGYFDEQEIAENTDPNDSASKPAFPTPLGFWSFDDQGETTTADLSPNGNDGSVIGGLSYVPGHSDRPGDFALDLDGLDDAVTTTLTLDNIGAFTMAGWIRFEFDQTNRSGLFGQNDILEFGFSAPSNVHLWSNPGGAINAALSPSEEWVHIAFIGDTSGRTIFIDGEPAITGAAATPLNASAFFFNIGGGGVFDDVGNFFQGQINDVGVWEVSMSPQLIKGLADGTISPVPGLGSGSGFAITDITINGGQATVTVGGTASGAEYIIEESTNLLDGWVEVTDFTGAGGASETEVTFSLPANPLQRNFYRAKALSGN